LTDAGRPHTTMNDLSSQNLSVEDATELALDRPLWRLCISSRAMQWNCASWTMMTMLMTLVWEGLAAISIIVPCLFHMYCFMSRRCRCSCCRPRRQHSAAHRRTIRTRTAHQHVIATWCRYSQVSAILSL